MKRISSWNVLLMVAMISGLPASPAWAVVTSIDANVTAEVREIIDGNVADTDQAFEELDETTGNLPLTVTARLESSSGAPGAEEQVSGAQAIMNFYDPRLAIDPDPDEFGVDLAAFSRASGIAYDGSCQGVETRQITFRPEDVNALSGASLRATSIFFVDGEIYLWAEDGGMDLTGTSAEVKLQVTQVRTGRAAVVVMSATLTLVGQADGSVELTATGDLQAENVVLVDLTGSVPDLGVAQMLVIPDSAIPYTYNASVNEDFQLIAQVDAAIANEPGTGASVVLGLPNDELVTLIDDVVPGDVQDEIGNALDEAVTNAPDPEVPLTNQDTGVQVVCCGLFGAESAMMLMIMATGMCVRHRRRWRGRS